MNHSRFRLIEVCVPAPIVEASLIRENARLRAALTAIEEYEAARDPNVNSLYSMMVAHGALGER